MWIALGVIGALWFVGAVIAPDKGGPAVFSHTKPPVVAGQSQSPPPAPAPQR